MDYGFPRTANTIGFMEATTPPKLYWFIWRESDLNAREEQPPGPLHSTRSEKRVLLLLKKNRYLSQRFLSLYSVWVPTLTADSQSLQQKVKEIRHAISLLMFPPGVYLLHLCCLHRFCISLFSRKQTGSSNCTLPEYNLNLPLHPFKEKYI